MATETAASDHTPATTPPVPSHEHQQAGEKTDHVQSSLEKSEPASKETANQQEETKMSVDEQETSKPQESSVEVENKRIDNPMAMSEPVKKADEPVVDVVSENKQDVTEEINLDAPISDSRAQEEQKVAEDSMPVKESLEKQLDLAPADYSEKAAALSETDSEKPAAEKTPATAASSDADSEKQVAAQEAEAKPDSDKQAAAQEAEVVDKPENEPIEKTPKVKPVTETNTEEKLTVSVASKKEECKLEESTEKEHIEQETEKPVETFKREGGVTVIQEPKDVKDADTVVDDPEKVEKAGDNKLSINDAPETTAEAAATLPEVKMEACPAKEEPTEKEVLKSAEEEKVDQKQTEAEDREMTIDYPAAGTKSAVQVKEALEPELKHEPPQVNESKNEEKQLPCHESEEKQEEQAEAIKTINLPDSSVEAAAAKTKEATVGTEQENAKKEYHEAAQQIPSESVEEERKQQKVPQSEVTEEEVRPPRESLHDLIKREREESIQEDVEGISTYNEKPPASEDTDQTQVDKEAARQHEQKKEDTITVQLAQAEEKSNTQEKEVIVTEEDKSVEDVVENGHSKTEGAQRLNTESHSTPTQQIEMVSEKVETTAPNPSAPTADELAEKPSGKETPQQLKAVEAEKNGRVEEEIKTRDVAAHTQESKESSEKTEEQVIDRVEISQDQTKDEVPAKPSSKQSSNIISKVKHSFVKAKKAIIGKSPSSKTITTDATKGDIKVK